MTTMEITTHMLRNLLAVIHGDGGHHTEAVGLERSIADAERRVLEDRMAREELEHTFEVMQRAERRAVSLWRASKEGRAVVVPEVENLIVWLLERLAEAEERPVRGR
jgi:hypothetical protein